MNDRLYLFDSYLKEFEANILETAVVEGSPAVVLDRTAFYPTSGGQMHDTGSINNIRVNNVVVEDDKIWHLLEKEARPEHSVPCRIDWERRFDFMQQHTAFHTLAQAFLRVTGAETLSSHLGEQFSTIDVDLREHDPKVVAEVEKLANKVIWEDRQVVSFFCSREEMEKYPNVRKSEAAHEQVRLVNITDFDLDPCGGTHVSSTGQVGLAKIMRYEKVRGCLRYTFVAGSRALREFARYAGILQQLADALTTGIGDLPKAVQALIETNKAGTKERKRLREQLLELRIGEIKQKLADAPAGVFELPAMEMADLRKAAGILIKEMPSTIALFSNDAKLNIVMATSAGGVDLRELLQELLVKVNGKGGGRPDFVQAGAVRYHNSDELRALMEALLANKSLA